jgi:hypothetical protein
LGSYGFSFLRLLLDAKKEEEEERDATTVAVQEKEDLKHSPALWIAFQLQGDHEVRHVPVFYESRRLNRRSD